MSLVATEAAGTRPAIDESLARSLVDTQFPQWAQLPPTLLDPAGSDHVIYRLGEDLSIRIPRHAGANRQARKEAEWLPRLAPHLPLAIPEPVAVGEPDLGYPWPWAVTRWLDGEVATVEALGESTAAAGQLAQFLVALQRFPLPDASAGHDDLGARPLADRDPETRARIAQLGDVFDAPAMIALWEAALDAPTWDRAPVWFHGDFHTGNLLTDNGRVSVVLDFGGLGVGDPACDLMVAFTLMSARTRAAFRAALGVDEATWLRGRGIALAAGLNAYIHYAAVDPRIAAQTTRQITAAILG